MLGVHSFLGWIHLQHTHIAVAFASYNLLSFLGSKTIKKFQKISLKRLRPRSPTSRNFENGNFFFSLFKKHTSTYIRPLDEKNDENMIR